MATFKGEPGFFGLKQGLNDELPTLGSGERIADFLPDYEFTTSLPEYALMNGTPTTHADQQRQAHMYGLDNIGFGDVVSFACHWSYYPATLFTVGTKGWIQEAVG